ncbi:MAG TPA: 16S rRNA (cytosine(1402)-N(4))-methyltransferase, partial [Candidatus Paceibacterota bacterium]
MAHVPVLLSEVIEYLNIRPGSKIIDATLDGGGHTMAIL